MNQNQQKEFQEPQEISKNKNQNTKIICRIRRAIIKNIISQDKRFTKKTLKTSSKLPHLLRLFFKIQSKHAGYQFLKLITVSKYGLAFSDDDKKTLVLPKQKSIINGITIWGQFKRIYHILGSDGIQEQRIIIGKYVDRWAGEVKKCITDKQKQKFAKILAYVRNNKINQNSQQYRQKKQLCQQDQQDYIFKEQFYNKKLIKPNIKKGMKEVQQAFENFQMKLNQNTFPSSLQKTENKLVFDLAQSENLSYPLINLEDSYFNVFSGNNEERMGIHHEEERMSIHQQEKTTQKSILKELNQDSILQNKLPLDQSWNRQMFYQHKDYCLHELALQNGGEFKQCQEQIDQLQDVLYLQKMIVHHDI